MTAKEVLVFMTMHENQPSTINHQLFVAQRRSRRRPREGGPSPPSTNNDQPSTPQLFSP